MPSMLNEENVDKDKKIIGACHAGWRGAKSGIIAETIIAMKRLGATNISAKIGKFKNAFSSIKSMSLLLNLKIK